MKFFVEPLRDKWQNKARAEQLKQAIREYNCRVTGEDGESFSIEFPSTANHETVQEFINIVNPKGVHIQTSDVAVLTPADAATRNILRDAVAQGNVTTEILPDQLSATLQEWDTALWQTPMSKEAFEAYAPPSDEECSLTAHPQHEQRDGISSLAADLDAELEAMHKAGIRE